MELPKLNSEQHLYIVICFVQEDELDEHRSELEQLGNRNDVNLVVQPCPYEGIEFLYRIDESLFSHLSSFDQSIFYKALIVKQEAGSSKLQEIQKYYHAYFCAVLDQDDAAVRRTLLAIDGMKTFFAEPDE